MKTNHVLGVFLISTSLVLASQSYGALDIVWDTPSVGYYHANGTGGDSGYDYSTGYSSGTEAWADTGSGTWAIGEVSLDQGFTVVGWTGNETVTVYADFFANTSCGALGTGDYEAYAGAEAGGAYCESDVCDPATRDGDYDIDSDEQGLSSGNAHYSWSQSSYTTAITDAGWASAAAWSGAEVSVTSD